MRRRATTVLALVCASVLWAPAAHAHAILEDSSPQRGAQLDAQPELVSFSFNEPVEGSFGNLRVYDSTGERVDTGAPLRPGSSRDTIAIRLRPDLGDGAYTATFRVVSADGHPVAGGFVFVVGDQREGPAATVAELIDAGESGPVTEAAFGAVRALAYAAMALAGGALAFLLLAWLPALARAGGAGDQWAAATTAFGGRIRVIALAAAAIGVATSGLGIAFQGATAAGTTLWAAFDPTVIEEVIGTRFGTWWAVRLLAWVAFAAAVLKAPGARELALPRPAMGASGLVAARASRPLTLSLLTLPLAVVLATPALSGHARTTDPTWLLIPADALHVVAMSAWVGGVAALLVALPAATRRLEPSERTQLLAACLARFSTIALAAVATIVATGVVQSVVHLDAFDELLSTAFGRSILAKSLLLLGLVALGALNRRVTVPRLGTLASTGEPPGVAGVTLRRALRAEIALMVAVLGVAAALVSYPPPAALADGPQSAVADLGVARLELVVDPAETGRNEIHLYLLDPRDGTQYDRPDELRVELRQPARDIGPIPVDARRAGPGHWVVPAARIAIAGEWRVDLRAELSDFEDLRGGASVRIR